MIDRLINEHFPGFCALWLHAALFLILANLPPNTFRLPSPPAPVIVELVALTPSAPPTSTANKVPSDNQADAVRMEETETQTANLPLNEGFPQEPAPLSTDPIEPDWRAPENWTAAKTLLAVNALNEPGSDQAKRVLKLVSGFDRREQICALEAMEQVRENIPEYRPTRLVPYALKNTQHRGTEIFAPAGALRSDHVWYEISYRCQLNTAGDQVDGFEYVLGPPIDRKRWDELGLPTIH